MIKKSHKRFGVDFPNAGHTIVRWEGNLKARCMTSYIDVVADANDPKSDVIDTVIVRHELDEVGGAEVTGAKIYQALLEGKGAIHCESLGLSGQIGLAVDSEEKPVGYYVGAKMVV